MDPTSGMTETVFGDPGELDELDPGELVGEPWNLSLCRLSFFCISFQGGGGSAVEAWWQRRGRKLFVFLSKSATCSVLGQTGLLSQISIYRLNKFLEVKHLLLVFGRPSSSQLTGLVSQQSLHGFELQ